MAAKEISVKKYIVRLSGEERERLEALVRKGKSPAQRLLKARILLKADVSQSNEGWSDSRIIKALETSVSMVYRVRKQLVEEGSEAVLSRKQRATPAVARIFDGEKEAKLIALACSKPSKERARWTLRLLENKVVDSGSDIRSCRTMSDRSSAGFALGARTQPLGNAVNEQIGDLVFAQVALGEGLVILPQPLPKLRYRRLRQQQSAVLILSSMSRTDSPRANISRASGVVKYQLPLVLLALPNHIGPEPCAVAREGGGEASVEEHTGQPEPRKDPTSALQSD